MVMTMWLSSSNQRENRTDGKNKSDSDSDLFLKNIGFLVPLCLKSLALRCLSTKKVPEVVPSVVLDMKHMLILEPLVEIIAKGFVNQALQRDELADLFIAEVLDTSNIILDFFVGLLALIHPSQVSWLIYRYLETLRLCEEDQVPDEIAQELTVRRIRVTRQLRLRAAEKFSSMPRFVALNFPYKYHPSKWEASNDSCCWTNQMLDNKELCNDGLFRSPDKIERLPESNWLAELLSNECFIICSQSCEVIVNGTISQVMKSNNSSSKKKSAMRQRVAISKQNMAHYQSIGYHSISVAYDLILRKHATDNRYQSDDARGRIAGIFVSPVIENAVQGVQWLSKLEPSNKIRSLWLLCILYVLQEAPETAIRKQMRDMCVVKVRLSIYLIYL